MTWDDERYVRLYTRDTPEWLCLSFLAQGLFCLLLRKVDRAGVLPLGRLGRRGAVVAIGHPGEWARLEGALDELLVDGCVRIEGEALVIPNFLDAQEAQASDRARAKKARERRRDLARAGRIEAASAPSSPDGGQSQDVTEDTEKHNMRDGTVTPRDASITTCDKTVTPSLAVPYRAEPNTHKGARAVQSPREAGAAARLEILGAAETYALRYPATAALLEALRALGVTGAWSRDAVARGAVEAAIGEQSVAAVAARAAEAIRASAKPWLGMHLDAIRGSGRPGSRTPVVPSGQYDDPGNAGIL